MAPSVKGEEIANRVLLALSPGALEALTHDLHPLELKRGLPLSRSDEPVKQVHFVNRGMVSLVKTMMDGRTIEVSATGIEGITTPEALFGEPVAALDSIVQIPGSSFVISRGVLEQTMAQNPELSDLVQRYIHVSMERLAQTAACNRLHSLEERCCRWLLIAGDSARADTFRLTHEFLAMMLGVQRPGVSLAMEVLQKAGYVRYSHGTITIMERDGLEATACECYATLQHQLERLYRRTPQSGAA
jgi:CRP-like cAMP-binding protein